MEFEPIHADEVDVDDTGDGKDVGDMGDVSCVNEVKVEFESKPVGKKHFAGAPHKMSFNTRQ